MKFFAVQTEDLESEQFIASTNDQLATWLLVHKVCSNQCNGGVIANAEALPERYWQRHGIDLNILTNPSPLWGWEGGNLILSFYDIVGQEIYLKKVEGGRKGGRNRKKGPAGSSAESSSDRTPSSTPNTPDPHNPTHTTPPDKTEPDFQSIVGAYPRREGVAEALRYVSDSVANGADPAAILTGTRAIAAVIQQLPSGHHNAYVVSAKTFFKNERWRDDPQTWLRQGTAKNGAALAPLNLGGRKVGSVTRIVNGEPVTTDQW
jgi:hypothetical protein